MTPISGKPFIKQNLKPKEDIFTVRCNPEERQLVNWGKKAFDIKSDSKALKALAAVGKNVLRGTFSDKFLQYMFKKDRERLSDYKDIQEFL